MRCGEKRCCPTLRRSSEVTLLKRSSMFGKPFHDAARAGRITDDFHALSGTLKRFRFIDEAHRIAAPVLVTRYEHEHTSPKPAAQQFYDALRSPRKLVTFTAAEGTGAHDTPLAPQRRNEIVFERLDEVLGVA